MYSTGNKTVDIVGRMHLAGNVIPHTWYSQLKLENGKPDMVSILLLSEIVYWYRPKMVRDEETGYVLGEEKRFASDLLQKSYKGLEAQFGWSEKQIRESLKRMEKINLVKRVFRNIETAEQTLYNVMFIELNPTKLTEITYPELAETLEPQEDSEGSFPPGNHPPSFEGTTPFPERNHPSFPERNHPGSLKGNTNTEITNTKITQYKDIKKKNKQKKIDEDKIPYQEIIDYLNLKAEKEFKHTASANRELIRGRFDDGFTLDDFKRVIDNKVREWKGLSRWDKFLRPSTLFAKTHFDNYLNEGGANEIAKGSNLDEYDFE